MKSVIKIFLLTLLSCCYINTVFEFSDTEKKANFENESHCYIHQDNNDLTTPTAKTVQHFDIVFDIPHQLNLSANWTDRNFNPLLQHRAIREKPVQLNFSMRIDADSHERQDYGK